MKEVGNIPYLTSVRVGLNNTLVNHYE